MAAKTTSTSNPASDNPALAAIRDMQSAGFASTSTMGTAWLEAMSDLGSEVLSFVAERVKEDVKTQHQILHAKSLAQVQHIQAEFVQKAVDQYSAETGKLVELSKVAMAKMPATKIMPD
ncbi:phasin protein [Litoreibacter halocynthiae]|uniref:Phasin protein n=1 Tax=Litoreibacter halocynthiae TaxID=1242689 RepID=A0A4R7LRF3_9RHOB|nr:phasin family protein [Litoreibacter halocynthiae]TDT78119.1 phasin protein [Litoreibacter halocynthiae]